MSLHYDALHHNDNLMMHLFSSTFQNDAFNDQNDALHINEMCFLTKKHALVSMTMTLTFRAIIYRDTLVDKV